MKTNRYLALLMALALTAIPAAALAEDLYHDDGTFEAFAPLSLTAVPAVQFDAPGTGVYALDSVSFYLEAAEPEPTRCRFRSGTTPWLSSRPSPGTSPSPATQSTRWT